MHSLIQRPIAYQIAVLVYSVDVTLNVSHFPTVWHHKLPTRQLIELVSLEFQPKTVEYGSLPLDMRFNLMMYVVVAGAVLDVFHRLSKSGAGQFGELPFTNEFNPVTHLRIYGSILLIADVFCEGLLVFFECLTDAFPHVMIEASDGVGYAIAVIGFVVLSEQLFDLLDRSGVVAVILLTALVADEYG